MNWNEVKERYSKRLSVSGPTPQALGWDKYRHWIRYAYLLEYWAKWYPSASILDFGCGLGDACAYIDWIKSDFRYSGIDINLDLILAGQQKYADLGVHLFHGDLFEMDVADVRNKLGDTPDVLISSGVHNLKIDDNYAFLENTIAKGFEIASRGVAINFMTDKVSHMHDHLFYFDPAKVLNIAYKYSRRVQMNHTYLPFEATIILEKDTDFDKDYSIYPRDNEIHRATIDYENSLTESRTKNEDKDG